MSQKNVTSYRGDNFYTPTGKVIPKDEPETPIEEDFGHHNEIDLEFPSYYDYGMRKSISMNDITVMRQSRARYDFHDDSNRNLYHRHRKPSGQSQEFSKTKFVSMAESIYHFQRDTPGRFHSTRPQTFRSTGASYRTGPTIPRSPILRSKARSRTQHILSQQEKEAKELEELKNFKIKPKPIPKSILDGPIHLPEVGRKPSTIPKPFNLSEPPKKIDEIKSPNQVPKFKARPAPKHILEKPQVPVKTIQTITSKSKSAPPQKPTEKPQRHGPIKPKPFSFESMDIERKKRKEQHIQQQLEEELKKAVSFKANPVPGMVKKQMQCVTSNKGSSSTTSSENKENILKFEARPPVVLYKEPFKPVLPLVQRVEPMPFDLTTEKRAADREKFDKLLKEKEEAMQRLKKQQEIEQEKAKDKEQMVMRANLVHHAKPAPHLSPFVPKKSSALITVPQTPNCVRRMKQH